MERLINFIPQKNTDAEKKNTQVFMNQYTHQPQYSRMQ